MCRPYHPRHPASDPSVAESSRTMKMSLMQLFLHLMLDPARPSVYRRRKKDERGFTLTELMVVIFIIGLLATVVMINVLPSPDRAMVTKARADISTLENALEQYRLANLVYPASTDGLNALVTAPQALAQHARYRPGGYIKKRTEEHPSELQSLMRTSYAVFCLKTKK